MSVETNEKILKKENRKKLTVREYHELSKLSVVWWKNLDATIKCPENGFKDCIGPECGKWAAYPYPGSTHVIGGCSEKLLAQFYIDKSQSKIYKKGD